MPARILIAGATGNVGRAVVRKLSAAHGRDEIVLAAGARNAEKGKRLSALGAEVVHLDYDDPASVRAAVAGVERLFLATGYSVDMLPQSKNVLDAARSSGVQHVVHLGAAGSDTQPYAHLVWHAYVERYIEALGFGYTHLQPKTYMNNVLALVRPGSTALRHYFGDARVPWIDIDDIAAVAAAALLDPSAHRCKTYRLATQALSMAEVAAAITAVTGVGFTHDARDPAGLLDVLLKAGMESTYATHLARAIGAQAREEIPGHPDVNDTVEQVLKRAATRWEDFARRHRERFLVAASPRPA